MRRSVLEGNHIGDEDEKEMGVRGRRAVRRRGAEEEEK